MNTMLVTLWIDSSLILLAAACLYSAAGALIDLVRPRPAEPQDRHSVMQIRVEQTIYRHHRALGPVLLAAVVFYLGRMAAVDRAWPSSSETAEFWLFRLATLLAVAVGVLSVILFVRPSRLKPIERWSNRWFGAPERPAPPALVLLTSGWCLIGLVLLLLERTI